MGKLAERYHDAARSGLYQVRDPGVPRLAAAEANALLLEIAAPRLAEEWARLESSLGAESGCACVLIVADAAALADPPHRAILARLVASAAERRAAGRPFFAVMVDPEGRLGLRPLYRESTAL